MSQSEEEIEEWFEEEKEKLTDDHLISINKGTEWQKAREVFDKKIEKAIKEYHDRHHKMWRKIDNDKRIEKPMEDLRENVGKHLHVYQEEFHEWKKEVEEKVKRLRENAAKEKAELDLKRHRIWKRIHG